MKVEVDFENPVGTPTVGHIVGASKVRVFSDDGDAPLVTIYFEAPDLVHVRMPNDRVLLSGATVKLAL